MQKYVIINCTHCSIGILEFFCINITTNIGWTIIFSRSHNPFAVNNFQSLLPILWSVSSFYLYYIYYSLFWTGSHTVQSLNNLLYLFTNSILGIVIITVVSFNALLLTTCFKVDLLHSLIFMDYLKIFLQSITIHLVLQWPKNLRIISHFSILFVPIFFSVMCI